MRAEEQVECSYEKKIQPFAPQSVESILCVTPVMLQMLFPNVSPAFIMQKINFYVIKFPSSYSGFYI